MKFALFSHVPWPEGTDPSQIFEETIEQVQYGEALGFHSAWLAEHHFSRYGLGSSSLMLAASIAARTHTIRLGTAVLVPPLHQPIRLAEDTATLDRLSNGRLEVGFGRGSAGYEYRDYDVPQDESQGRFQEAIKVVEGLWTTPDYTHEGQFFKVNHATLVPPPVQQPHPPLYIAATRTRTTLEFVASTGHPLIIGVVLDHVDAIDLCHRFVAMSAAAGYRVPMARIPLFRYFYVGESEEQVRRDTRASLEWTLDMIQWRGSIPEGSEVYQSFSGWRQGRTTFPPSYESLAEKRAVFGTPESCAAKIREFQQQGFEFFGCNFAFGGMDHQKVLRSMELFANEVMPRFA